MKQFLISAVSVVSSLAMPAWADSVQSRPSAPRLSLARAEALALQQQPQLLAQAAEAEAARASAIAAAQLPDPKLSFGFRNLPIEAPDPYAGDAERMAMTHLSISQAFPRAKKRALRRQQQSQIAALADAELAATTLSIRRGAAEQWLGIWAAERETALLAELIALAQLDQQSARINAASARLPQTELLAVEIQLDLLKDRRIAVAQRATTARDLLARWVGQAAYLPVPDAAPELPDAGLEALLAAAPGHPLINGGDQRVAGAKTGLALAQAERRPDWWLQTSLAYRQPYDDLISLEIGFDLPIFPGDRQDGRTDAARARLQAAESLQDDQLRELLARIRAEYSQWQNSRQRLGAIAETIARAEQLVASAQSDYSAGRVELRRLLQARRSLLDLQLLELELQTLSLRSRIALRELDATEVKS